MKNILEISDLELKVSLQVLRDYTRLVKTGSNRANSPEWVFRVYRAVHKVIGLTIDAVTEDNINAMRLTKPAVANHFYTMLNDLWHAVEKGTRFPTPSCISLELIQTSSRLQDQEKSSRTLGLGLTSAVNDDSPTDVYSKDFGRNRDKYVNPNTDLLYVKKYEFISKWSRLENHLNDMVNVCLATGVVYGGEIGESLEANRNFT